jgi:hypothetical protein
LGGKKATASWVAVSAARAFFVHEAFAGDHFLDPPTAEEHYEPPRYFFSFLRAGHPPQPGPYVLV